MIYTFVVQANRKSTMYISSFSLIVLHNISVSVISIDDCLPLVSFYKFLDVWMHFICVIHFFVFFPENILVFGFDCCYFIFGTAIFNKMESSSSI